MPIQCRNQGNEKVLSVQIFIESKPDLNRGSVKINAWKGIVAHAGFYFNKYLQYSVYLQGDYDEFWSNTRQVEGKLYFSV